MVYFACIFALFAVYFLQSAVAGISPKPSPCPYGTFREGKSCKLCPPGTYQDQINRSKCKKCPEDTYSPSSGVQLYLCRRCPPNSWSKPGSSKCNRCPPGHILINLTKCIRCLPGTAISSQGCKKCQAGYFTKRFNEFECKSCPECTTASEDRTQCIPTPCPNKRPHCFYHTLLDGSRSKCGPCPDRFITPTNSSQCQECPPGTYVAGMFDNVGPYGCFDCPKNSTTFGPSKPFCTTKGKPCPKEAFRDADGDCNACGTDEFRNLTSNRCTPCSKNQYSFGGTITSCTPCLPGQTLKGFFDEPRCQCKKGHVVKDGRCQPCPKGTQIAYGNSRCDRCDANKFADKEAMLQCKRCPPGTSSWKTDGKRCLPLPKCQKGYYIDSPQDGCISRRTGCPPGTTLKPVNSYGDFRCTNRDGSPWCPYGTRYYPKHSCAGCTEGHYLVDYEIDVICEECAGYSRGGPSTVCNSCPRGFFGRAGRCICGGYWYIDEKRECSPCPKGNNHKWPPECFQDSYYYP